MSIKLDMAKTKRCELDTIMIASTHSRMRLLTYVRCLRCLVETLTK